VRYRIAEVRALKELAFYLMSNPAGQISFNKLKEQLRLGSVNTVRNYIDYLENSWLLFTVNVYDYSVKRQQIAPKKVYGVDTGLIRAVGFSFSPNTGKLLENLVFVTLRRKTKEIYYYTSPGGYEVDFYLPQSGQLIQVAQDMNLPQTREREIRALMDAMQALNLTRGLILSETSLEPVSLGGRMIEVRAIADWLLEERPA
jgi:predicted AAA+ superfamily ATPase